jgi:exopolysaccharide biosynthesis protein
MKRVTRNVMLLGISFGVLLAGGAAYNLYDTFVAEHETTAEYLTDSSSATSTSTSSASGTSTSKTTSTTTSTSTSTSTSAATSSETTSASPYAKTAVTLVSKSAKNSDGVTSNYYIADIELKSYDDLKTHLTTSSSGSPGPNYKETVTSHVSDIKNAGETPLVAINGDSAYYSNYRKGYVIRNGLKYRSTSQSTSGTGATSGDCFATYSDGTGKAFVESSTTTTDLMSAGCYQCWCFGPTLLENSSVQVTSSEDVAQCKGANQRTAIGYIGAYHFVFFVSEGRINNSSTDGFSLYEMANLLKDYGCVTAYNLDGGGASYMWYGSARVNTSSEDRSVGDIVYVKAS